MKRIGIVLAAYALASEVPSAAAEALPIEHVLVSVPLHKKTAETALPVTVLSGDALRRGASNTLGDTLRATPGLANASFGPGVGQPVIRGQQGARVTVLQNGTSSADASNLSADHANAVEPMLAESIEILRGPATLLYGGGAIGGVVNIVDNRIPTSVPEAFTGGIEVRYDSASELNVAVLRADAGANNFAFHIDGLLRDWSELKIPGSAGTQFDEHDEVPRGEIANTDGKTQSSTLGGSYHFDGGFAGFSVNTMNNDYGIPSGAHSHEEHLDEEGDIRLEVEQIRYDAALHWHEPTDGLEVVRGFLTYTDYAHEEIEASGEVGTRFENNTFEGRLELVHQPWGAFHGVLGLQVKSSQFSALGEEAFVPRTDSEELGFFLLEDFHANDWTYEAGIRVDRVERIPHSGALQKRDFTTFSVSGSMLWEVSSQWQLGLALSRAERAPATEELFSNIEAREPADWIVHAATDAIELGSIELDTEVSNNIDGSLRWFHNAHSVDVTLFYNDFSDYINLRNTGTTAQETVVFSYAQDDAEFYGVEIDSNFVLGRVLKGDLTLGLFADVIRGELKEGDNVPRLPPQRVGLRLGWSGDDWKLWSLLVKADDQDKHGANEAASENYLRWDLGGEYRLNWSGADLLFSVEAKNLGDEEIRLSTSFLREVAPEAGRSVVASVRYTF